MQPHPAGFRRKRSEPAIFIHAQMGFECMHLYNRGTARINFVEMDGLFKFLSIFIHALCNDRRSKDLIVSFVYNIG